MSRWVPAVVEHLPAKTSDARPVQPMMMTVKAPSSHLADQPIGTVIIIGHPANRVLARKHGDGWRYVHNGQLVEPEDFRAGWDTWSSLEFEHITDAA